MKIGILTYHRAENYGALLQAYATMSYLRSLGHEVLFVDYWPKYHYDYFTLFPWFQVKKRKHIKKLLFLLRLVIWIGPRYLKKKNLTRFMHEHLGLSEYPVYNESSDRTERFDAVIYGSDQIWRKQNLGGVGFDDWYFGSDNVRADRKIVYAGSMGVIQSSVKDDEYVRTMMGNFNNISVREKDLQTYLSSLGVQSTLVIDPVFLLSYAQWKDLARLYKQKGKYILFYNLLNTKESLRVAEALKKETNLPIVEITKIMSFKNVGSRYQKTASVEQFLQLIDAAEYVVSNSFHGVAMSVIFRKQFFAAGMGERANRVKSLLEEIGLSERYINDSDNFQISKVIDYQTVSKTIDEMILSSKKYLEESLA